MIRELDNGDKERVLAFAGREPEANLFLIGDVENFGVKTDFQQTWADESDSGELRAVLLRYFDFTMFYAPGHYDRDAFLKFIDGLQFRAIMGVDSALGDLADARAHSKSQRFILARLNDAHRLGRIETPPGLRKLSVDDVERVVEFRLRFPEFGRMTAEAARKQLEGGYARGYWIEQDGEFVAMAQSTAECSRGAMIVGVGTLPPWRKKGYASMLTASVCRDLLAEGKPACLFYDNPNAGAIYRRLGFEEIGFFRMLTR